LGQYREALRPGLARASRLGTVYVGRASMQQRILSALRPERG
jgi:hypothetical protein